MADERTSKALDKMSFKQKKKEWRNARKRLEPENEYLEELVKNLEMKLRHKQLLSQFQQQYSEEIEKVQDSEKLDQFKKSVSEDIKEESD